MNTVTGTIDPRRMGFAGGATGVVFYLGCVLTMATVSHDRAVAFFSALAHGIDVDPILRHSVPFGEVVLGIIGTFVLGWFAGALIAAFLQPESSFPQDGDKVIRWSLIITSGSFGQQCS
jgi:hypothetical protein